LVMAAAGDRGHAPGFAALLWRGALVRQ
jgi:hypothetical protein